jgi:hypothetical protein
MRWRVLFSGTACALFLAGGCSSVNAILVGRWRCVAVEGAGVKDAPQQAEIEFREDGTFQGTAFVTREGSVTKQVARGEYRVSESGTLRVSIPGERPKPPVKIRFEGEQLVLEEVRSDVRTRFDRVESQ